MKNITTNMLGYEDLAWKLSDVNRQIDELKKEKARLEDVFKTHLENADIGIMDGYEASYKHSTRRDFNKKRFAADHPDLVEQYTEEKEIRTFRLKVTGDGARPDPGFEF